MPSAASPEQRLVVEPALEVPGRHPLLVRREPVGDQRRPRTPHSRPARPARSRSTDGRRHASPQYICASGNPLSTAVRTPRGREHLDDAARRRRVQRRRGRTAGARRRPGSRAARRGPAPAPRGACRAARALSASSSAPSRAGVLADDRAQPGGDRARRRRRAWAGRPGRGSRARVMATAGSASGDGVVEPADALDDHAHRLPRGERADARRRPRHEHVTRVERHDAADEHQQLERRHDHVADEAAAGPRRRRAAR